ncbi:MAG: hypothetical protein BMS9Abin31_1161 [Gammaproteobacteria bacterium]|nr:MAG: hypothetical protein BMS9Abin31_1161 [Gammaproteobacteria bacterium]
MVYRLAANNDRYMVFHIEPKELRSKMGDDIKIHMGAAPDKYINNWVKPNSTFYKPDNFPDAFDIPDLALWGEYLVLNEKAYEVLHLKLDSYGEFLPVNCEGLTYYLFNVLKDAEDYNGLDEAESEYNMFEGSQTHLKKLVFKEDALASILLFRSKYEGHNRIFCNNEFKHLVEASKFNGLIFKTDLEGLV